MPSRDMLRVTGGSERGTCCWSAPLLLSTWLLDTRLGPPLPCSWCADLGLLLVVGAATLPAYQHE